MSHTKYQNHQGLVAQLDNVSPKVAKVAIRSCGFKPRHLQSHQFVLSIF